MSGRKRKHGQEFTLPVRSGSRFVAAAAAASIAAAAGVALKKPRMEVDHGTLMNSARSSYTGNENRPVLGYQQFLVERGVKRTFGSSRGKAKKLRKLSEQFQKSIWSKMTPNFGSATSLVHQLSYNISGGVSYLPMFLWDLSSLPVATSGSTGLVQYNKPAFQLTRTNATGLYAWNQLGYKNDQIANNPSIYSYLQSTDSYAICDSGSGPGREPFFAHDWTSVGISVMGATTRTTRLHVAVVEFDNCAVGPKRVAQTYSSTWSDVPFDTTAGNVQVYSASNFWDRFWSKKLNNPLYDPEIPKDGRRHMRVLHKDLITIGPETTTNEDTRGRQVQKKYFFRFNDVHTNVDPKVVDDYDVIQAVALGSTAQTAEVNVQGQISTSHNFGVYSKNKYLMVYADVGNLGAFTAALNGSFDIVIKNKHTVKN